MNDFIRLTSGLIISSLARLIFVSIVFIQSLAMGGCASSGGSRAERIYMPEFCTPEECAPNIHQKSFAWGPYPMPALSFFQLGSIMELGERLKGDIKRYEIELPEAVPRCGPSCKTSDEFAYTTRMDLPYSDTEDPACNQRFAMNLGSFGKSKIEVMAYFALANQIRDELLPEIGDECRKVTGSAECGVVSVRVDESPLGLDLEGYYNELNTPQKLVNGMMLAPGEIIIIANVAVEVTCGKKGIESLTGAHVSGTVAIARVCEEPTQEECAVLDELAQLEE